jgi:hypothetical protein
VFWQGHHCALQRPGRRPWLQHPAHTYSGAERPAMDLLAAYADSRCAQRRRVWSASLVHLLVLAAGCTIALTPASFALQRR